MGSAFLLTSCAETRLVIHTAKKIVGKPTPSTGSYKVGKPYQIEGTWYYPAVDYNYRETGVASWYGRKFHKRKTANGQIFDMNAVSAAHRTLPMPSIVQVTNLNNGRSMKVLINDRGPFARGRIIDLSRRAAQLLGFERAGTALVRVEIVAEDSRRMAQAAQRNGQGHVLAAPPGAVKVTSLPGVKKAYQRLNPKVITPRVTGHVINNTDRKITIVPLPGKTEIFVQAGAFVRRDLAIRMKRSLASIGKAEVIKAKVGNRQFFRVRIGPINSVEDGDKVLNAVILTGNPNARLVVN